MYYNHFAERRNIEFPKGIYRTGIAHISTIFVDMRFALDMSQGLDIASHRYVRLADEFMYSDP